MMKMWKLSPLMGLLLSCSPKPASRESAPANVPASAAAPASAAPAALAAPATPAAPVAAPAVPPAALTAVELTADMEISAICPGGYSEPSLSGFFEEAVHPIATVVLGHYEYSDVPECHVSKPVTFLATVEIPRTTLNGSPDRMKARRLNGDLLRGLGEEECTYVYVCDDSNRNGACDEPAEAGLNRYNDRSRYLPASVSRPARFTLTVTSRDDRFCGPTNYYSRCCPAGYAYYVEDRVCLSMQGKGQQPSSCPPS